LIRLVDLVHHENVAFLSGNAKAEGAELDAMPDVGDVPAS
jgi:hypothetical protein